LGSLISLSAGQWRRLTGQERRTAHAARLLAPTDAAGKDTPTDAARKVR